MNIMKKLTCILSLLILILTKSFCSSINIVEVNKEIYISKLQNNYANISAFMFAFYDSTSKMSASDINRLTDDKWIACSDTIHMSFKSGENYWLRFNINNDTNLTLNRLFYFSSFDRVELYTK